MARRAQGHGQAVPLFWTDLEKAGSGTVVPVSTDRSCQISVHVQVGLKFVRFVSWFLGRFWGGVWEGILAWKLGQEGSQSSDTT